MESEKYNLGKAQEEAEKLRKKVESGEASSYSEAEKLIETGNEDDPEIVLLRKQLQESGHGYRAQVERIAVVLGSNSSNKEAIDSLAKEYIISHAHYGDWENMVRAFHDILPEISNPIFSSTEIKLAYRKTVIDDLTKTNFGGLFDRYKEKKSDSSGSKENETTTNRIKQILAYFDFSENEKTQIIKEAVAIYLGEGTEFHTNRSYRPAVVKNILAHFPIEENDLRDAIREGLIKRIEYTREQHIGYGYLVQDFKSIIDNFSFATTELTNPEVQKALVARSIKTPFDEELVTAGFPLPNEAFLQKETKENCKRQVLRNLYSMDRGGYMSDSEKAFVNGAIVLKRFKEAGADLNSDQEIVAVAQEKLLSNLRSEYGGLETLVNIKSSVQFSDEFTSSEEYLSAFRGYVIKCLDANDYYSDQARKIRELSKAFEFSKISEDPEVHTKAIKFFSKELKKENLTEARDFLEIFNIKPEEISEQIKQEISRCLQSNLIQRISDLTDVFSLEKTSVEEILKPFITKELAAGNFEKVIEIKDSLKLEDTLFSKIDIDTANQLISSSLIKFVKYLGNESVASLLPNTILKAQEMIFAKLATDQDLADYFVENLDKYYQQSWVAENVAKAIQQYSVAQKFIYAVENDQTVWKNEVWAIDVLAKAKVIVEEHHKQFPQGDDEQDSYGYSHGNEGFSETDPFENHPWLFGGQQIKIASAISEMMAGKANTQELEKLGINADEISPLLAEANEKVNTAYQNFLEQIRSNTSIKDEDKQALLEPESSSVKMTSLLNNIRSFVARYFIQSVDGDTTRLSEIGNLSNDLDRILAEGFNRYIKIHEVDVPLYDKLYEEFDTLRETGRSPLEVYLGRDGIYAYIGRHSQDVARRRKLGLEGRKKLKEMGEVVEIHPQYTVYPRYFRDNLNQETKRQFLEQEGISPDADPLFYDTGYTGTIPEQIMRVMDFSDEDIERRIRLLSAPSVHRRVKGIPENARSEIIEYIEHNAKTEETAEGLIIDEKTGKIRHIAKPTNPEEQFYFMMVKQAVARHYWLQEQLHHEPSGNVNLDSEHYTIRIRQEYAKLLPPDFMQNPKEFLTQHGEMLKGSKGEGEYPDEEVVLFKMTDGTEIVAKKIELRKAKEARKEFSILISAKKAGLPTAEPVGFLSGKEDTDGSYLLMKKIEGISGRNFDKYLRDTGKFTEEKIKSILQQVAQKNKEMAELFRTTLKIDKRWRIKDTIIELNEETGEVENVIPIDWERAQNFNSATPKEIDEIA